MQWCGTFTIVIGNFTIISFSLYFSGPQGQNYVTINNNI